MITLFEQETLNPVSLEQELGLNRGDILSITVYPDGAVEVDTQDTPSEILKTKIREALSKRGLPKGKKASDIGR